MARIARWIGGGLGWALGGPIGAILGFVFGSVIDNIQVVSLPQQRVTHSGDFNASLLVLSAAIMKADGKVLKAELDYVKGFFITNFGPDHARQDMLILREILKKEIDIREVSLQIRQYMSYPERLQLMHYLFGIARSDAEVSAVEESVISQISNYLGINNNDYLSLKSMFVKDIDSAYKILEISANASDDELKKAYRKMAMKYHPDKVAHLGEDIRKAAEIKFRELNKAYEEIKQQRGLN